MVAVAIGGGLGAIVRYLVSLWLNPRFAQIPLGTLVVNLIGSFLLGFVVTRLDNPSMFLLCGTGFCGGLTTFSTLCVETYRICEEDSRPAALNLTLHTAGGLLAAALGYWLGSR